LGSEAQGARILVVDDNATNLKLLDRMLGVDRYDVSTVDSGAAALAFIEENPPDLVLLDVIMPEMSGYEVCRAIRAKRETRLLPVIMVTALDPSEERVKGIEAGADDFLEKPINGPELLARIRSLLETARLHKQVESQAAELAELNRTLEARVAEQVGELDRLGQLKRFLPPQVAELVVSGNQGDVLETHRRNVTIASVRCRASQLLPSAKHPRS
jgi:DNA-binding response OmpR family regulator